MKTNTKSPIAAVMMLLIWGIITLLLALSIVGLFPLAMMADDEEDGWFTIPNKCIDKI